MQNLRLVDYAQMIKHLEQMGGAPQPSIGLFYVMCLRYIREIYFQMANTKVRGAISFVRVDMNAHAGSALWHDLRQTRMQDGRYSRTGCTNV